ncbi:MAG: putative signal transducing protein [Dehalococcoidia bacterium]
MSAEPERPERDPARERIVPLASFDNVVDAEIARARLEDAGIRVLLKNADGLAANQGFALALSQLLFVLEGDVKQAEALLAEVAAEQPSTPRHHPRHRRRPGR